MPENTRKNTTAAEDNPVLKAKQSLQNALQILNRSNDPGSLFEANAETRLALGYINLANNAAPRSKVYEN